MKKAKQYSIIVSDDLHHQLETVKKTVYGESSHNAMLNDLIRRGLRVAEYRDKNGQVAQIPARENT